MLSLTCFLLLLSADLVIPNETNNNKIKTKSSKLNFDMKNYPGYNTRIIGGTNYDITKVPYQVSLQTSGFHTCGGSILTPKFILTAAHCIADMENKWPNFMIRAGSSRNDEGGQVKKIKIFYPHPEYIEIIKNDIAILELDSELELSETVQPINLPSLGEAVPYGKMALLTGWGKTAENGQASKQLLGVQIPLHKPEVCEEVYKNYFDSKNMICAADNGGGHSSCQGDSGGPLVANGKQWGIVSWAVGCARPNMPTVFAHVANLRGFIKNIVGI